LGVQLVRLDCQHVSPVTAGALVQEVIDAGLVPYPIVREAAQLQYLPAGLNVEWMNEPDLNGPAPAAYERAVHSVARLAEDGHLHLWAGGVSNLNARGFRYLRDAGVQQWPASVAVSVHRYPHGDHPTTPHGGFTSREHEVETLRALIGSRPWGVSEFGYHTANRAGWLDRLLGRRRQWTDDQVAAHVAWEWAFWARMGAAGAVLYQITDGDSAGTATPQAIDTYGIRRLDGTWKPVAATFAKVKGG
jgi:hypothetical protein